MFSKTVKYRQTMNRRLENARVVKRTKPFKIEREDELNCGYKIENTRKQIKETQKSKMLRLMPHTSESIQREAKLDDSSN